MIQEDKEILLIDLCARLPYGTKVRAFIGEKSENDEILGCIHIFNFYAHDCKPYLRPMSSMTEEEIDEFTQFDVYSDGEYVMPNYEAIDWLNKHHFDYRIIYDEDKKKYMSMIEKGLAIEAPEGLY